MNSVRPNFEGILLPNAIKFRGPELLHYPLAACTYGFLGMIGTITVCDGDFCGTDSSGDVGVSATHHNYAINYVLSSLLLLLLVVL